MFKHVLKRSFSRKKNLNKSFNNHAIKMLVLQYTLTLLSLLFYQVQFSLDYHSFLGLICIKLIVHWIFLRVN